MRRFLPLATATLLGVGSLSVEPASAQMRADVAQHVDAARAAAGDLHVGLFSRICPRDPAEIAAQATPLPAPPPTPIPGRPAWYVEPARVFDNLYYVGQAEYSAWAVATPDGIIVIDAVFEYSVEDAIVEGLRRFGLDPATIRYVIVSHAHRDHAGGARHLQERFGARVVMSEADWDLLEASGGDWPKPVRDIVAVDGHTITLGGTTLTLHLTPGHTPGTISTLVPVTDGGRRHVAAAWGGTAFNFRGTAETPREHWLNAYRDSADRFRAIARAAGADVLIANHASFDGSVQKLAALPGRGAGDPHPYVIGAPAVADYLTVAAECARATILVERG
jgi:metallo-beta-lactamase class B